MAALDLAALDPSGRQQALAAEAVAHAGAAVASAMEQALAGSAAQPVDVDLATVESVASGPVEGPSQRAPEQPPSEKGAALRSVAQLYRGPGAAERNLVPLAGFSTDTASFAPDALAPEAPVATVAPELPAPVTPMPAPAPVAPSPVAPAPVPEPKAKAAKAASPKPMPAPAPVAPSPAAPAPVPEPKAKAASPKAPKAKAQGNLPALWEAQQATAKAKAAAKAAAAAAKPAAQAAGKRVAKPVAPAPTKRRRCG